MTVKSVQKDTEQLTLTLTAEFDATANRVWQLWSDPRQLERWWGPPGYPATFVDHDFTSGGNVIYYMTSPEGEKYHGWWRISDINPPGQLEFVDGFGDSDGNPNPDMPTTATSVAIEEVDGATRMTLRTKFPSEEAMQQLVKMGMEEGLTLAVGQIDEILSEDVSSGIRA
ncbi:MAG TPA: SRPBCC domain-containing protein [Acidimicrobiia bacterium]